MKIGGLSNKMMVRVGLKENLRLKPGFLNSRDRGLEPRFSLQPISRRIVWIL
jgi:hypothetical protein